MKIPKKRGRGRPPLAVEAGQRYQVTIPPRVAKTWKKLGKGSLSAGISRNPAVVRMEHMKDMIRDNERQIEMFESGKMTLGFGAPMGSAIAAKAEAARLRSLNEELKALTRQEEAWERRQKAFFVVHAQFLPHGNGQPNMEDIDQLEVAEKELKDATTEVDRIVQEIRSGRRR
jgi:hypothetical protein